MTEVATPGKQTLHLQYTANLCHPIISTPTVNQFFTNAWDDNTSSSKENFPTAPLDDDLWSEDPIPDRCLCIHKTPDEINHQCSYPCPY